MEWMHNSFETFSKFAKRILFRMRDLSAAEKTEYLKLEKQLEKKNKEIDDFKQKKVKLSDQLEEVLVVLM